MIFIRPFENKIVIIIFRFEGMRTICPKTYSGCFYTWRASVAAASSRLATELYRSAGNVLARLSAETLANANLLEMVDLVTQGRMEQSQLDARALTRFKNVARTLETALVRLDLQMALFNDM